MKLNFSYVLNGLKMAFTVSYHSAAMQCKRRILNFLFCKQASAGNHLGSSMRHNCWMAGKLQTFSLMLEKLAGGATDGTNV